MRPTVPVLVLLALLSPTFGAPVALARPAKSQAKPTDPRANATPGPTDQAAELVLERQLILPADGHYALDLSNLRGRVVARGWNKNVVYVHASKRYTHALSGEEAAFYKGLRVAAAQTDPGHVTVSTVVAGAGEFASVAAERIPHIDVDYEVFVPPDCALSIGQEDGSVLVIDVRGKVDAFSRDGDLALTDVHGWAEASNERGNLKFSDIHGDAVGKSIRGDLHFVGVSGDVKATTLSGNVRIDVAPRQVCEVGYQTVSGKFRSDLITFHTDMEPGDTGYRGVLRGPLAGHDRPLVRYAIDTESGDAMVASDHRVAAIGLAGR